MEPRTHSSRFSFIGNFSSHLRALSPSDAVLMSALAVLFLILSFAGLYTLERYFLVAVPSYGGTLTEGVVGTPRFINPLLALTDADRDLVALTYAGLMGYTAQGTLRGVLAESYEISPDGTLYTFTLRETARFSNGSPVTAEDVVFTIEKAQDPALRSPELPNWTNIRVEAIDARTVRFTLPAPYAPFLGDATLGILPAQLWRNVKNAEFAFSPLSTEPVGAGAFTVAHVERDTNGTITRYRVSASKEFALGRPYLDAIQFVYFDDTEALLSATKTGRVESAYGVPLEGAIEVPYSRVFGVFWNASKNPLFGRIEVRKALSVVIDRDALIAEALGGYGTPLWGPVPPRALPSSVRPEVPENRVEEARKILLRNDWVFDETEKLWKHEKDGLSLSVTLSTGNIPELKAVAQRIRSDFALLGVPTEVNLYEPSELATRIIRPREYEALLFGMAIGREHDLFAFWDSSARVDPGLNVALYANRAVDELLEDIRVTENLEERSALLQKLDTMIAEEYPAAFTHAPHFLYVLPENLRGPTLSEVASPSDRFTGVYEWYLREEAVWPFLRGGSE
ncbi:MAG: peptide ABC transporter substrate-binding protein [Minisyncoccia bacterium]